MADVPAAAPVAPGGRGRGNTTPAWMAVEAVAERAAPPAPRLDFAQTVDRAPGAPRATVSIVPRAAARPRLAASTLRAASRLTAPRRAPPYSQPPLRRGGNDVYDPALASRKIYVGNLRGSGVSYEVLLDYFRKFGEPSVGELNNKHGGAHYRFVLFATPAEAQAALKVTSHVVNGVAIKVGPYEPRAEGVEPAPVAPKFREPAPAPPQPLTSDEVDYFSVASFKEYLAREAKKKKIKLDADVAALKAQLAEAESAQERQGDVLQVALVDAARAINAENDSEVEDPKARRLFDDAARQRRESEEKRQRELQAARAAAKAVAAEEVRGLKEEAASLRRSLAGANSRGDEAQGRAALADAARAAEEGRADAAEKRERLALAAAEKARRDAAEAQSVADERNESLGDAMSDNDDIKKKCADALDAAAKAEASRAEAERLRLAAEKKSRALETQSDEALKKAAADAKKNYESLRESIGSAADAATTRSRTAEERRDKAEKQCAEAEKRRAEAEQRLEQAEAEAERRAKAAAEEAARKARVEAASLRKEAAARSRAAQRAAVEEAAQKEREAAEAKAKLAAAAAAEEREKLVAAERRAAERRAADAAAKEREKLEAAEKRAADADRRAKEAEAARLPAAGAAGPEEQDDATANEGDAMSSDEGAPPPAKKKRAARKTSRKRGGDRDGDRDGDDDGEDDDEGDDGSKRRRSGEEEPPEDEVPPPPKEDMKSADLDDPAFAAALNDALGRRKAVKAGTGEEGAGACAEAPRKGIPAKSARDALDQQAKQAEKRPVQRPAPGPANPTAPNGYQKGGVPLPREPPKKRVLMKEGRVYILYEIGRDGCLVKIGYTAAEEGWSRIRNLQTGMPGQAWVVWSPWLANAYDLEQHLHKVFAEFNTYKKMHGGTEWFSLDDVLYKDLREIVEG